MMALSKKMLEQEPSDLEMLLPWYAAGTLNARDTRRVEEALARDPELARQYAVIREEYAETIGLNESLGAPSVRAMQKLFAAIDAEPARKPDTSHRGASRIAGFFVSLSPRTLAWSASLGALALLLQEEPPLRALVRFKQEARMSDITALLDTYQASIIGGAQGGMFRLQFGGAPMRKDEAARLIGKLQSEKIVGLAVAAP